MTVRLYDSRAQALREFTPADPGNVTMYVCGPTVQSGPGIHHLRAALAFDLLRRWLQRRFGRVTFVRNVTDIDDKVLANATPAEPWWALAYRVEREFDAAYAAIGILPPTYEPRATASIPQMQELIQRLIDAGHAYAADGDVYFDVRSWPDYGSLTHQSIDAMEPATDADGRGKRDPRDFALWKAAKPGEPADATWGSPWGPGRPGWHIECSAMSRRYLGSEFDIHGGGLDSRTTRTSSRSPRPPATASRATGCTMASSPSATRRCRSLSATSFSPTMSSPTSTRSACAMRSPPPTTCHRWRSRR